MSARAKKPVILVSSTVYGIQELLELIYTLLTTFGYEVWMSHKGTLPVRSGRTAFENCLAAVEACDLFLGIITPSYGSGKDGDDLSITHQELQRAIALNKPRWLLAHNDVVFARRLLRDLDIDTPEKRHKLKLKKGATSITDLHVIDMYEEAIRHYEPLSERNGNWVQEFSTDPEAKLFVTAQFSRFQEVKEFIDENLSDPVGLLANIDRQRGGKP
jgi:Domain of unknown function (DUF4062)